MRKTEILKEIETLYKGNGLNSVNVYLKKNTIKHKVIIHNFGLKGNKAAEREKTLFLEQKEKNTFRCHYFSISIQSKKTGFGYNKIRAKEIILI